MRRLLSLLGITLIFVVQPTQASVKRKHLFLPVSTYFNLSAQQKIRYIKLVQAEIVMFEREYNRKIRFADAGFSLFPEAYADAEGTCSVGGVVRRLVNGKCPTYGRSCGRKTDSFRCGKIYGGICVSRLPIETLSQRCHENAKSDLSYSDYVNLKQSLEPELEQACSSQRTGQQGCGYLKSRLADLNRKFTPEPTPAPPPPGPASNDKYSVVREGDTCKSDRDQGAYGTCHAFCLTCYYDQTVREHDPDFRVSANWLSMLSVVDRMCDSISHDGQTADQIKKVGWNPDKNLALLSAVGACDQKTFLPYSEKEGWERQFDKRNQERGINLRPAQDDQTWMQNFGIDGQAAYDLFCPEEGRPIADTIGGYGDRLKTLEEKNNDGRYNKFLACAKEGLERAKRLSPSPGRQCALQGLPRQNAAQSVKEALRKTGRPVPLLVQTDVEGHQFHCVTATGFDDKTGQISLINSWGKDARYSQISYEESNKSGSGAVLGLYSTGCIGEPKSSSLGVAPSQPATVQ